MQRSKEDGENKAASDRHSIKPSGRHMLSLTSHHPLGASESTTFVARRVDIGMGLASRHVMQLAIACRNETRVASFYSIFIYFVWARFP